VKDSRRRAERLTRWYSATWRQRYGEEFVELLVDDMRERPHSWSRDTNVALSAARSRLSSMGISGAPIALEQQASLSTAWLALCAVVFGVFAIALWSQLDIGWQWARPTSPATDVAVWVITLSLFGLVASGAFAIVPITCTAFWNSLRGRNRTSVFRLTLLIATVGCLAWGTLRFSHGWPGTGGHSWTGRDAMPSQFGPVAWSISLSITAYWVHPAALFGFPTAEMAWMILSPLALLTSIAVITSELRSCRIGPRMSRWESAVARATLVPMATTLLGVAVWLVDGTNTPRNLYHRGVIDLLDVVIMVAAILISSRAVRRWSGTTTDSESS
jgi:hypothetical protein